MNRVNTNLIKLIGLSEYKVPQQYWLHHSDNTEVLCFNFSRYSYLGKFLEFLSTDILSSTFDKFIFPNCAKWKVDAAGIIEFSFANEPQLQKNVMYQWLVEWRQFFLL